jgi:antitoxin PrlF
MVTATLTSKGQTTIPHEIRSYLGLHTGDKVNFLIEEDGRVYIAALTSDVRELKGMLPKPKKVITIEQMKKAIVKRGAGYERD